MGGEAQLNANEARDHSDQLVYIPRRVLFPNDWLDRRTPNDLAFVD